MEAAEDLAAVHQPTRRMTGGEEVVRTKSVAERRAVTGLNGKEPGAEVAGAGGTGRRVRWMSGGRRSGERRVCAGTMGHERMTGHDGMTGREGMTDREGMTGFEGTMGLEGMTGHRGGLRSRLEMLVVGPGAGETSPGHLLRRGAICRPVDQVPGEVRQDEVRQGEVRQGEVRQGEARQGEEAVLLIHGDPQDRRGHPSAEADSAAGIAIVAAA